MKLLVLTAEPISADILREAAGDEADDAEVMVVSPALTDSPLRFWVSDADDAIADAQSAADETAGELREGGAQARATTGDSEPLVALQDALATYPADHVLVFARGDEGARYREEDVLGEARRRFGVPVTEIAR